MNDLQIFKNKEFGNIRIIEKDGEPWFVGKDIAEALGYQNTRKAIGDHVDDDDKKDGVTIRDAMGRDQSAVTINESGLYSLVLSSKLPSAKQFKRWVTSEVLPTIRKTGSYAKNQPTETQIMRAQAQLMNAQVRKAKMYAELAKVETLSATYKEVMVAKAADTLNGGEVIPLPKLTRKTFSATEVGEILGVSSQKVGAITNKHNLKTAEYGEWYRDKAKWSNKEVDTFKYYDNAIPVIKGYLGAQ